VAVAEASRGEQELPRVQSTRRCSRRRVVRKRRAGLDRSSSDAWTSTRSLWWRRLFLATPRLPGEHSFISQTGQHPRCTALSG
jgi:hypothetical protein